LRARIKSLAWSTLLTKVSPYFELILTRKRSLSQSCAAKLSGRSGCHRPTERQPEDS
jgi:hypothetical protein